MKLKLHVMSLRRDEEGQFTGVNKCSSKPNLSFEYFFIIAIKWISKWIINGYYIIAIIWIYMDKYIVVT